MSTRGIRNGKGQIMTIENGNAVIKKIYYGTNLIFDPTSIVVAPTPEAGYGTPPSADSDCFIFYDAGNTASYPGSGTTVTDLKGNANATLTGDGWSYDGTVALGVIDQAGKGTNNRYMAVANPGFSAWTASTFEFLWRADQSLSADNGFARWVAGSGYNDSLWESSIQQYGGSPVPNRIYGDAVSEEGTNVGDLTPSWTPTTGNWYHFVFTMEQNGNYKLYVNNSLLQTATGTFGASDTFLWDSAGAIFGVDNYVSGNIVGQFASFRMYDVALTSTQVTANYDYYATKVTF